MAARGKKLLLNEKVEVRSLEDGLLGSWHCGVVSGCGDSIRVVRYDHILCDEGSDKLIEHVKVTPAIDGVVDKEITRSDQYRGLIRPSPPCDIEIWSLHYGLCVDLLYNDAWWEGVVFDHEDGSETRRIFFPDLGDEREGSIKDLRLSMDWDEVTEEWKPRGNWLFLELTEEVEQEWHLLVSVKQIWYEVRMKNEFEKLREWTSTNRELWKELMLEVFSDNLKITIKQIFAEINSSHEPGQLLIEFSEEVFDSVVKSEGLFHNSLAVIPSEATSQSDDDQEIMPIDIRDKSNDPVQEQNDHTPVSVRLLCDSALPKLSQNADEGYYDEEDRKNKRQKWKLVHYEAEYLPDAIEECNKIYRLNKKKKPPNSLRVRVYKYLVHLGWKIESARDDDVKAMLRKRYISPSGDVFYSFIQICKMFDHDLEHQSGKCMSPNHSIELSVSSSEETLSHSGKSQDSSELSKSCPVSDMVVFEPVRCPEAVRDYYLLLSRKEFRGGTNKKARLKAMKVKKHLSAVGWSFHYCMRQQKRELRYTSPTGKTFCSLATACKWLLDCELINDVDDTLSTSRSHLPLIAMDSAENLPEKFVQSTEGEAYKTRMSRKRKMHDRSPCIEGSPPPKRGREPHASVRTKQDSNADSTIPVTRSSKRVRERIASSSQQTPRTVLSWLIENNVILPRAEVQYRHRKNGPRMAEGRITGEGIKCSCCGVIFSLGNFERHARSSDHRPSANIFLEDGRSLLECQLQLRKRIRNRSLRLERENQGSRHYNKSDCICSVCHDGGELVLCDQCPTAFHTQCLGLKEVPDGDWFCLSCCCQICNKCRLNKRNRITTDSSFLICSQCERRYHAGCLKNRGDTNCVSGGDWFCHDTCQQIFYGLREILGKKIPVGTENLTWSLVKCTEFDFSEHGACDDEGLVERYSKLNVALSVMHECFEPFKEPWTKRDLMEDVISNRWSELHRLNFQGFYTVILEKGDEMVSVATVRVHGKTVAEVPLVATRFRYRRHGMCRILMDELEKKLAELGVERLVLPAIPSVLHTWTTAFGFSQMNDLERLNFLSHTFLNFPGTIFCQKMLNVNVSALSSLSPETRVNSCDHAYNNAENAVDQISAVSEVLEGKQVANTDIMERESACIKNVVDNGDARCYTRTIIPPIVAIDDNGDVGCSSEMVPAVDLPTLRHYSLPQASLECPAVVSTNDKKATNRRDGVLKCYERRRISAR